MRNEHGNCALASVAAVGLLLAVTSSAGAWGLSDEDYDYLRRTQSLERYDAPVLNLGPKELSRLHNLINDPQPDAAVRDKSAHVERWSKRVMEALGRRGGDKVGD